MFFDPPRLQDRDRLRKYFDSVESACMKDYGVSKCKCTTDPTWLIEEPLANMTHSLFCLPDKCRCRNKRIHRMEPFVRIEKK